MEAGTLARCLLCRRLTLAPAVVSPMSLRPGGVIHSKVTAAATAATDYDPLDTGKKLFVLDSYPYRVRARGT